MSLHDRLCNRMKKIGVGDKGQRYEITYRDIHTNERKVFGWSEDVAGVQAMHNSVLRHPSMADPETRDRQCPTCEGKGEICVGTSGFAEDGNAPVMENCPECNA